MSVRIIQTADPHRYREMLEATARTAVEFARRHGHRYESYVGIKRGDRGLHAAFNRLFLLRDMERAGYRGWVLYMDADAYVWDLDFDLDGYLADKSDRVAVMATIECQPVPWSINSGVLLFNMAHPLCRPMLDAWMAKLTAVPDDVFNALSSVWAEINDQGMLFQTLDENEDFRNATYFEHSRALNHKDGQFIRQFMSAFEKDVAQRTEMVKLEVGYALRNSPAARPSDMTPEALVTQLYRKILGRDPDHDGMRHYVGIVYGYGPSSALRTISEILENSAEYKERAA